jgi:hypothetical protein
MLLNALSGLVLLLLMLLQCKPISYFWSRLAFDPSIQGYCIDIKLIIMMTYIYSAFAALCDFTVGILPIFIVRNLNMPRKTKTAAFVILSMACM